MDAHSYGKAVGDIVGGTTKFIGGLIALVVVLVFAVIVLGVGWATSGIRQGSKDLQAECEKSCAPRASTIHEGECHCLVAPETE